MNTRSTFIAILAILLALPVAAETFSGTCGDNLSWTLNTETGVLDMTGFGSMNYYEDAVSIPWYDYRASIRTINLPEKMTGIAPYAFFETQISSITIPDSVCYINRDAFEYCKQLTSVTLPDGLLYIHEYAFAYCTKLLSLTIPSSVKDIYWSAFDEVPNVIYSGVTNQYYPWGAKSINGFVDGNLVYRDEAKNKLVACSAAFTGELTIPESVTTIGNNAFAFCENITKVTIPNTTIEIEASAFENCTNLRTISLPDKINQISKAAFYMCENLESITIPNSVEFIYENAFNGCKNMTKVTFGNAVEGIYRSAFWGCETLTSISLPASLRYIRETAFGFCKGLSYVKCEAITPPSCESNNVFIDVPIIPLYVPAQSISAYEADKNWTFYGIYALEDLEEDDDTPTTSGDVLTVAQAITIVDKLEDGASSEDTVTVEGFVVNAEKFNPLFKNQIFYLADDASNSGAQRFQAHFCRAVENGDTVPVMNGDKVRLTGKLKKYIEEDSSVLPEIHLGTASFVSKVEGDRDLYRMSIITVSQALAFAADLQTNETGTTEYIIRGFVTSITENTYNTEYKSMTFWMADEKNNATSNAEDAFYVYRGKPDVELQVGDEVYVDTKLKNYNGTIESETGVSVRFIEPAPDPADQRTVTLKVNNAEWGTVSGGGTFYKGDTITITATPNDGYVFVSWSNGDTNAQTQFVVGGNEVVIAQFAPLPQAEPITLNMNAVEIDYYPSYNSDKGYDYFLILYTYEDNAVKAAPLVAFDIYTATHKDFAGEYNLSKENLEVQYGAARIPSSSDGGYDEYNLSDAGVTITMNADSSYTIAGYITVSTGQVYTFSVTDTPYYCDVEHEKEPETPKTLNLTMVSGEINMQYIDKGKIYLNFLTADSCKVVLSFGTADSTAVDIKDGTYSITQNTKETFWAGRSYNSSVYYSYAAFGDDIYYLTSGSVTITTLTAGRFISVNVSSYYGSQFKFTYLIENPAEQKYSIFVFANDSRLGTVTGGGQYVAGTQITLTATPANGSRFEEWSNGSTENTLTITVTSEATYVAIFKAVVSSTADETGGSNQYDVKGGVVDPWTNGAGHLPQNTDSTEDYLMLETPSAVSVQKIIRDCQLYILRNGEMYNVTGARVK